MKSREEIIQLLREAKPELADRFRVHRLAVFGSFARGEQRENSDIDILVEVDPSIGLRFVDLADELEKRLALKVDLVSRRAISPRNWEVLQKELIDVPWARSPVAGRQPRSHRKDGEVRLRLRS